MELPPLICLPSGEQLSAVAQQLGGGGEGRSEGGGHTDILHLLRIMLAQALNQQDRNLVAQLHETIRCVSLFDEVKIGTALGSNHSRF